MAVLTVRAQTRSRREGFGGWFGETPRLAVPRRSVRLVDGTTARTKRFEVDGLGQETVDRLVERLNPK